MERNNKSKPQATKPTLKRAESKPPVVKKEEVKGTDLAKAPGEVQEEPKVDRRILYVKIGGGSARLVINGVMRILKPDEKFRALPEEIPSTFKNVIVPLNRDEEAAIIQAKKAVVKPSPITISYSVQPREGTEGFDVVNSTGKVINEDPLTEEEATKLKNDLMK